MKEEDKNILIGDSFIAPAVQQFAGTGNVFIIPDQASIASYEAAGAPASLFTPNNPGISYNANTNSANAGVTTNNGNNPTTSLGTTPNNGIVPGFVPEPTWPCVGEQRIVPDYMSIFPQSHQVAPFAGATRRLCDRKEVTLADGMGAIAKFWIYTSVHTASKFTGGITDDYTSEFDPFSPQFGEKFAPPNLPVSVKDWTGTEVSRVYADQWGAYNGMTYSTWEVNPPNPTGYSPTMMVMCMNDPGPILDTRPTIIGPAGTPIANLTLGQVVTDPAFTNGYSQFCYELPFMPETTQYLDTPVVPTSAYAGAGYNNVDCSYPTLTPSIKEVDGDAVGPWVSAANKTLTITSLGDTYVANNAYNGPAATTAPYNQRTRASALWLLSRRDRSLHGRYRHDRRQGGDGRNVDGFHDHGHGTHGRAELPDHAAGAIGRAVRRAGGHGRRRAALGRHGHGDDRRQAAHARRRDRFDPECDRRGDAG